VLSIVDKSLAGPDLAPQRDQVRLQLVLCIQSLTVELTVDMEQSYAGKVMALAWCT